MILLDSCLSTSQAQVSYVQTYLHHIYTLAGELFTPTVHGGRSNESLVVFHSHEPYIFQSILRAHTLFSAFEQSANKHPGLLAVLGFQFGGENELSLHDVVDCF